MKSALVLLFAGFITNVQAQRFGVDLSAGANLCKLIPATGSSSQQVKYGFGDVAPYLGVAVRRHLDERTAVSIGYQLSENNGGVNFRSSVVGDRNKATVSDFFLLHNITGGFYYKTYLFLHSLSVESFVKLGIAYGEFDGTGSSGGGNGGYSSLAIRSQVSGYETTNSFWMPNAGIGVTLAPNRENKWIKDRLGFTAALSCGLLDPYKGYSTFDYNAVSQSNSGSGTIRYKGIPMQLQLGMSFRI